MKNEIYSDGIWNLKKNNYKIHDVVYTRLPLTKGRLIIKNEGKCILRNGLKFNSTLKSNFVGIYIYIYKPCTISIRINGIWKLKILVDSLVYRFFVVTKLYWEGC